FDVGQPLAVEAPAGERGRREIPLAFRRRGRLAVREIDEAIALEVGMERDVEYLIELEDVLQVRRRLCDEASALQQSDASFALGDQRVAHRIAGAGRARQERDAPRMREPRRDDGDADLRALLERRI